RGHDQIWSAGGVVRIGSVKRFLSVEEAVAITVLNERIRPGVHRAVEYSRARFRFVRYTIAISVGIVRQRALLKLLQVGESIVVLVFRCIRSVTFIQETVLPL